MIIHMSTLLMVLCVFMTITLGIMILVRWEERRNCDVSFWVLLPWFILLLAIDITCLITSVSNGCY
ncbi:MAG TPA: hypothetical protein ENH82_06660 [bacterium]|nr:hypothetical protein [bacterium]